MMYTKALIRLAKYGCDLSATSGAVDTSNQQIESCIHELAHAIVARLPIDKDAPPIEKYDDDGLTNRIEQHIRRMKPFQKDRNEEITLAVEMLVLDKIGIPYDTEKFVVSVDWRTTNRNHVQQIQEARERKATRKHAQFILRYLHRLNQ